MSFEKALMGKRPFAKGPFPPNPFFQKHLRGLLRILRSQSRFFMCGKRVYELNRTSICARWAPKKHLKGLLRIRVRNPCFYARQLPFDAEKLIRTVDVVCKVCCNDIVFPDSAVVAQFVPHRCFRRGRRFTLRTGHAEKLKDRTGMIGG